MNSINAIQILEILETNSFPIKVLGKDLEIYYAKTFLNYNPPFTDVINEIIGNKIYKSWGINVPEMRVITISNNLLQSYIKGSGKQSKYSKFDSDKLFFIGFKEIEDQTELDCHTLVLNNKQDYNKLLNPTDFIDIALCDLWLGNRDRRINNPNLLLVQQHLKISFFAIDHTQLFAYQSSYKSLNINLMDFERNNMLITSNLFKKICTFADRLVISEYSSTIIDYMNNTIKQLPELFEDIPSDVGLSSKGRRRVIEILSDESRNNQIADSFKNYIK